MVPKEIDRRTIDFLTGLRFCLFFKKLLCSFSNNFAVSLFKFLDLFMDYGNSRVREVPLPLTCDQAFKIRMILVTRSFVDLVNERETRASRIGASGSQRMRSRFAPR